jgi:CMP-N,N'-diacetyllegionaminic acid synthase
MIDGRRVLAVITARSGSKGLPGKNLRPLAGKPLIAWTAEAARGSEHVDRTIATSDSEEILAAARAAGAETVERPADLARDDSAQEDAVLHTMDSVEREEGAYDYVAMLAPTNPLRDASELDAGIERLHTHPAARAIMSVVPCEHHPLQAGPLPADGSLAEFMPPELRRKNRQELPDYYRLAGSVCVAEWDWFRVERSFLTPATYALVTTPRKGIDIDSLEDFLLAELLLNEAPA